MIVWLVIGGAVAVVLAWVLVQAARTRPGVSFTAAAAADLPIDRDRFWDLVLDVENPSAWTPGTRSFRWLNEEHTAYEFETSGGTLTWRIVEERLPEFSSRRYQSRSLGVGIFEIHAEPSVTGTRVSMVDHCQPTRRTAFMLRLMPHKEATIVVGFLKHLLGQVGRPDATIDFTPPLWSADPIPQ
jgi:hypothetical protein